MPVHVNKIGDFQFLEMTGPPFVSQEQFERIERPGVAGVGLRRLGKRGQEFELITTNYEESFESAKDKMDDYIALKDDDSPVELIRQSVSEGDVFVLEVRERDRYAIFNAVGGIQDDPGNPVVHECCHIVSWRLLG